MREEMNYWQRAMSRRMSRRGVLRAGVGAGLGLAGLSLAACGQPQQQKPTVAPTQPAAGATATPAKAQPVPGGVTRYTLNTDPLQMDPFVNISNTAAQVMGRVYSRLVMFKIGPEAKPGDSTIVPDLSDKWEQPDELTYVFNLRKGVKFQNLDPVNGREVDSADVKWSFDRLLDPKTGKPYVTSWKFVNPPTVTDKYTVKFTTKEPFAPFWGLIAHGYNAYVVPKELVEKFGDLKQNAIGSGPFILHKWDRNVKTQFRKNPDYFIKGLPYVDGSEILIMADQAARDAAFYAGELDYGGPGWGTFEEDKKRFPDAVPYESMNLAHGNLMFNTEKKPFDNVKVRNAIKMVMDQQAMIDVTYKGHGYWAGAIPTLLEEFALPQDELKKLYKKDVAKAKQLLAEAGYPNGLKSDVYISPQYGQSTKDNVQLFIEDCKAIGVDLELRLVEYAKHLQDWQVGNYNVYFGPRTMSAEPDDFLYEHFHPDGGRNFSRYKGDAKMKELAERQRRTLNKTERIKAVQELQRYVAEVNPEVPIPYSSSLQLYRGYLKGWGPSWESAGTENMYRWLSTAERRAKFTLS